MRVLYVTPYAPSLIRVRPYQLIRALARAGHDVTLACPYNSPEDAALLEEWPQLGVTVLSRPLSTLQSYLNCLRHLSGRMPSQAVFSWQPALMLALSERLGQHSFDIVHVEHIRGAIYGLELRNPSLSPLPGTTFPCRVSRKLSGRPRQGPRHVPADLPVVHDSR